MTNTVFWVTAWVTGLAGLAAVVLAAGFAMTWIAVQAMMIGEFLIGIWQDTHDPLFTDSGSC